LIAEPVVVARLGTSVGCVMMRPTPFAARRATPTPRAAASRAAARATSRGESRRTVAVRGRESSLNVAVPFAPTEIRVDPDGKLLLQTTATGRR